MPAPEPRASALPSTATRVAAFLAILIAGGAGALIGYGFVDLQCDGSGCTSWSGLGAVIGGAGAAGGTAVVAVLVMRAMGEWQRDAGDG